MSDSPQTKEQPTPPPPPTKIRKTRSIPKPTPERALAIMESLGSGHLRKDVARISGLSDFPSKKLGQQAALTLAQYTELFQTQAQELVQMGLQRMRETLPASSIGQATMAVGILSDKLHQARPKSGDVHLHLHSSQDRNALLGSLLGTAQLNREKPVAPIDIPAAHSSSA